MDVAALILAILAVIVFLSHDLTVGARHLSSVGLGLALLTAALICQFVAISGDTVMRGH